MRSGADPKIYHPFPLSVWHPPWGAPPPPPPPRPAPFLTQRGGRAAGVPDAASARVLTLLRDARPWRAQGVRVRLQCACWGCAGAAWAPSVGPGEVGVGAVWVLCGLVVGVDAWGRCGVGVGVGVGWEGDGGVR